MTYTLIIWFMMLHNGHTEITRLPFDTKQECDIAKQSVRYNLGIDSTQYKYTTTCEPNQ